MLRLRARVGRICADTEPWSPLEEAVKTMELCEAIDRGHRGAV